MNVFLTTQMRIPFSFVENKFCNILPDLEVSATNPSPTTLHLDAAQTDETAITSPGVPQPIDRPPQAEYRSDLTGAAGRLYSSMQDMVDDLVDSDNDDLVVAPLGTLTPHPPSFSSKQALQSNAQPSPRTDQLTALDLVQQMQRPPTDAAAQITTIAGPVLPTPFPSIWHPSITASPAQSVQAHHRSVSLTQSPPSPRFLRQSSPMTHPQSPRSGTAINPRNIPTSPTRLKQQQQNNAQAIPSRSQRASQPHSSGASQHQNDNTTTTFYGDTPSIMRTLDPDQEMDYRSR